MIKKENIRLPNGEELSYIKLGSGDKNLILIHGNYATSYQYIPLLKDIPLNYTIYAIDLRGFGDSSYYRRIQSLEDFANDIVLFTNLLEIDKFSVIGWSLGGGVAMQLAAILNEKVEKLVLISSTTYKGYPLYKKDDNGNLVYGDAYSNPEDLLNDKFQVKPIVDMIETNNVKGMKSWLARNFYGESIIDDETLEQLAIESLKQRNLIDANFALATFNMGSMHNFYTAGNHAINHIKCPILHIVGQEDKMTPKYMSLENYYRLLDQSKLLEYERCGHSLLIDNLDAIDKIYKFIERNSN